MSLKDILSRLINTTVDPTLLALGSNSVECISHFPNLKVILVDLKSELLNTTIGATNKNLSIIPLNEKDPNPWNKFFNVFPTNNIDILLVNQSSWDTRFQAVQKYKNIIPFVIVPDCDYFPNNGMFGKTIAKELSDTFTPGKFHFGDTFNHFTVLYPPTPWPVPTGPPVLLGSNTRSVDQFEPSVGINDILNVYYTKLTNITHFCDCFPVSDETIRAATA
jgi:hypothetical protein